MYSYRSLRGDMIETFKINKEGCMIQQLLQLWPSQDQNQDQLGDIHTSFKREEQKPAAGN